MPIVSPDHLDLGAVELRQHLAGHHLVGRAEAELAVDDVEDQIDKGQDRVDLVGHEQDGGVVFATPPVDQVDDHPLVGEVERQQRLVAEQHAGIGRQCLRDSQSLLLAAGQPAERDVGVGRRVDLRRAARRPAAAWRGSASRRPSDVRRGRGRRGRAPAAGRRCRSRAAGGCIRLADCPGVEASRRSRRSRCSTARGRAGP